MVHKDIPHDSGDGFVYVGTAGWNVRRDHAHRFAAEGSHLQRYASLFNAVEINSCFYRPHRLTTYERWAASVPDEFRFAVKLPKAITHEARLVDALADLDQFLAQVAGLGRKLGPILVQLPPSLAFDHGIAVAFFGELRARFTGDVVLEPRHPTWFTAEVEAVLVASRVARVAADPPRVPAAAEPAGLPDLVYVRLHGSPRIYYSAYSADQLDAVAKLLAEKAAQRISTWCIFDNTALGAATADAAAVRSQLLGRERAQT
jgi:uncharacterized protein YecE (DUF72 family)